jgi:hypothetical protein
MDFLPDSVPPKIYVSHLFLLVVDITGFGSATVVFPLRFFLYIACPKRSINLLCVPSRCVPAKNKTDGRDRGRENRM